MNGFKMRVKEGQTAKQIQDYMFSKDFEWPGGGQNYKNLDKFYFYAHAKLNCLMSYGASEEYFNSHEFQEISVPTEQVKESVIENFLSAKSYLSDLISDYETYKAPVRISELRLLLKLMEEEK